MGRGIKMRQLSISYTDLKAKATELSAAYHYIDFTTNYGVFVYDSNSDLLFDALPQGADETDFETNIKPTATLHLTYNALFQVLEGQLVSVPKRQVDGFRTFKKKLWRKSFKYTAPFGVTTVFNEKFTNDIFLFGGIYKSGTEANPNDYVEFEVVDIDGITFPAGTVLAKYIETEYIEPGKEVSIISEDGASIKAGWYLRARYVSTGTVDVPLTIRYMMRK